MSRSTLARHRLDGAGWAHPYTLDPFTPVLYADGGDPTGQDPATPPAPTVPAPAQPAAVDPPQPAGQQPAGDGGEDIAALPDWAQKAIKDARAEAGKARTTAKANAAAEARDALVQQIGGALGLLDDSKDGAPLAPEELTRQLTAEREQAMSARIELHLYRTAQRLGANAEQLLDSRAFVDSIDSLDVDPSDVDAFTQAVEVKITEAVANNPSLRASQGPGRSGADLSGGTGAAPPSVETQIAEAQKAGNWRTVMRLQNDKLPGLASTQDQ